MNQIRANQKAFALLVSVFLLFGFFVYTWQETNILLKLLQLFFSVGFYFFVLYSFKLLSQYFIKHKDFFGKMNVFSYFAEYLLKAGCVFIYLFFFLGVNYSVMRRSDYVKGVASDKCYNLKSFNACYDFFQLVINSKVSDDGKKAFDFTFNQCQEGKENFCSHYVWMVDSYPAYQEIYKDEALDAAVKHKLLLTQRALMTEEFSVALAMNGKYEDAIKVQKQLVKYAKQNNLINLHLYERRLQKWVEQRMPASKVKVDKKK